jgi:hypothetical protein
MTYYKTVKVKAQDNNHSINIKLSGTGFMYNTTQGERIERNILQ